MKVRILHPEEHDRLVGVAHFENAAVGPDPEHTAVVVVEDDLGKIRGYWCAFDTVHLEPLWIDPSIRGNGKIGRRLWETLRDYIRDRVPNAFAMIADEDVGTHFPMAARLGFKRLPVQTFYIELNGLNGLHELKER